MVNQSIIFISISLSNLKDIYESYGNSNRVNHDNIFIIGLSFNILIKK